MNALERLAHHVHRIREEGQGPALPDQSRMLASVYVFGCLGEFEVFYCVSNARSWLRLQPRTMLKPLVSWYVIAQ